MDRSSAPASFPATPSPARPFWDGRGLPGAFLGIAALAVVTLFFVTSSSEYMRTFNTFLLAIIGALALNLLLGTAGLVSIGNPAFMIVGAYTVVVARQHHIPMVITLLLCVVSSSLAGVIVGLPAIRLRGLELALATMAGFFIFRQLASEYQRNSSGGTAGFYFSPTFASKGLDGTQHYWAWTFLAIDALLIVLVVQMSRHRSGRAWRMLRDHDGAASALGIPVVRWKLLAFSLTSGLIGLQGGLLAYFTGSVSFEYFTFELAVVYLAMVMIGGLDSVAGSVVGAAVVTALPVLIPKLIEAVSGGKPSPTTGGAVSTVTYGALIVCFVMSSQSGLVGLARSAWGRLASIARRRSGMQPKNG